MKLKYLSLIAGALVWTSTVQAEDYAGLGYGQSWNGGNAYTNGQKHDFETFSSIWSAFIGRTIPLEWFDMRVEGEFIRMDADADKGRTRQVRALMANATGIIPNTGWFAEPYVGLGVGYARYDHNNTIATQVIGGLEYTFDQWPVATALEYRHLWFNEDGGKNEANRSDLNSDSIMLKVKYLF